MRYKKYIPIIAVLLLSIIPLLDLFHPGFPVTHDGQDHIARIANFYQNLQDGNFIPRWAPNLNWGYGHPILMFLYPLPSYTSSFFHFLGFSLIDSVKMFFGFAYIFSGIAMYLFLRNHFDKLISVAGTVLYLYAPYRFVDLYVRGAIGEHTAFIFPPLVLYFLFKIYKKYSNWYLIGGALSLSGLILSHNAISLMFLPLITFYASYLIYLSKHKRYLILHTMYLILLGFGLASFFWFPAFFEGKYTLRNIVTAGEYATRFVNVKDLFYGEWNYGGSGQFTVQLGLVNLIMLFSSVFLLIKLMTKRNKNFYMISFLFIYSLIAIFLMTSSSNFIWKKIMILQNFQFPWRLLSILVFTTAFLGSTYINFFSKKKRLILSLIIIFFAVFLSKDYWHAKSYLQKPQNFFTDIYYSSTDTGESAPVWSVRFMEKTPKAEIEVIEGTADIKKLKRTSTEHIYKIKTKEKVRIRENTLYFPGWKIFINGIQTDIQFQDPANRGLMTFYVEKGEYIVDIKFSETKLRYFSNVISLTSFLIILLVFLLNVKKRAK